ncbi:MAG: penicillin-binding protein 1C [Bacteroidia bacterium]
MWRSFPIWLRRLSRLGLGLYLVFIFANILFPLKVEIEYSPMITDQNDKVLYGFLSYDDKWRLKLSESEISPQLEKAILFKEDRFFFYHPGINPVAIGRAIYNNSVRQRRTSGASTITMQLARLLEPKNRTYRNKTLEMFRALQLEWKFSKKEILCMYLNLVPYGGNIEGIKSASELYFEKSPQQLSLAEIATLVVIPNRPTSLSLVRASAQIETARKKWLNRFEAAELFPLDEIRDAIGEEIIIKGRKIPRESPHLARRLRNQSPTEPIIKTTIELEIQRQIRGLVKNHIQAIEIRGIHNAAAIVIDNETMGVVAYVGSQDFFDSQNAGQVDGVKAIRAPGSTLKPLLYALAIDEGLITNQTVLLDVPMQYGTYEPENFDSGFRGKVTASNALSQSLNVPAVRLLHEIGVPKFLQKLEKAGFEQITKDQQKLGLSVVLGGCGASLEELSRMYAAFANQGKLRSIRYRDEDEITTEESVFSPAAVYLITETLSKLSRPDLPVQWHNSANLPKVAWKTGTSYGRRDAWSIGYSPRYTVGVWVGNFDGTGVPDLYGAGTAAPLLFNIFNQLPRPKDNAWFEFEEGLVVFREVCSESGQLPEKWCNSKVLDMALPGISPYQPCEHMRTIPILADSSLAFCTDCMPDSGYINTQFANYPPELLHYYQQNRIAYTQPPPHNPDCERIFTDGVPLITSPQDELEYLVMKEDTSAIMLSCQVGAEVHTVYWYVNDHFIGSAEPNEAIFHQLPAGTAKISCSDDKGRNSHINIMVKHLK